MADHTTVQLINLGDVPDDGQDDELEAAVLAFVGAAFEAAGDLTSAYGALVAMGSLRDTFTSGLPHVPAMPKAAEFIDRAIALLTVAVQRMSGGVDD